MKKNMLFCFLFVFMSLMSHNSFASIVTYNLDGYGGYGELNGFIAFESVGIPHISYPGEYGVIVDFKLYDFFLATPNEVLIQSDNTYDNIIRFYATTDTVYWNDDANIWVKSVSDPWEIPFFIQPFPEDGSLIFAPNTFDIFNFYGRGYRFFQLHAESLSAAPASLSFTYAVPEYEALTYTAPEYAVSQVDEPGAFTFVLYGLLSVCLIAIIKRTNIIKC